MLLDNGSEPMPDDTAEVSRTDPLKRHSSSADSKGTEYVASSGAAADMLGNVFGVLENAGVRYCVLHGYENYPQHVESDVDGIIDARVTPAQLYRLLYQNRAAVGDIVRCSGYYVVLGSNAGRESPSFLRLDFTPDCEVHDLPLFSGTEILQSRKRYGEFWIPSAKVEFGCYLARSIAKRRLDETREQRLNSLYKQDPGGCEQQVLQSWSKPNSKLILSAARSSNWQKVRGNLDGLRRALRLRAFLRYPLTCARNQLGAIWKRAARVLRPDGLNVVFLGPDGAGKSSVVENVGPALLGALNNWTCLGFAPPILQHFTAKGPRKTDQPHALPARSLFTSLLRAAYWFAYYTLRYPALRLALARSTLVLNDRDFLDILVDQKRYRYGGPLWLLRLIWRVIPKPDLIILLDAPPEVLQARKQEVGYEETRRQRNAYLSLVRSLDNGRIVDASQPLERVARDVSGIIVQHLAARATRRLRLDYMSRDLTAAGFLNLEVET